MVYIHETLLAFCAGEGGPLSSGLYGCVLVGTHR